MFSFYLQTPAGFQIEFGHGARVVGDDWDDDRLLRPHQRLGSSAAAAPMSAIEPSAVEVDCDVAIVGAGPSGLVLAILLAQLGRSVVVLEQWPAPYTLPRAVHFDDEVGRLLQSCGIGDELRAVSEPAEVYEWRNAAGTTLLRFGRIGTGASGWPFSSMFCQPELEAVLEARADSLPTIEIRRGVAVDALEQNEDLVTVGTSSGDPVRARYVVGCDGANSTVRELLDIGVDDRGFFYDWLIVDVFLDEPRVFDPINLQICDPNRPTTAVSGGPGRRRWEFMRLPDETREELNQEAIAWKLLEPWDVHPGNARIERHAVYTFQARVADRWQDGRVVPRRRRRAPDAAVRGPGHVLRDPRRGQPRVEARPGPDRTRRTGAARDLRGGAAARRGGRDRHVDRARQGHLRPRPGRGRGARRGHGRGRHRRGVRGARTARPRGRARPTRALHSRGSGSRRRTSAAAGSTTSTARDGAS